MKDKTTKRVFSIIMASILIIAISVTAAYYKENQTIPVYDTGVASIEDYIEDKDEETVEDNNSQTENEVTQVKAYANGYNCITDALKVFDASPGLKVTSEVTGVTDILGIGTATQYVKEVKTKSGQYFLKETWAHCSVSLGQNFYRCFYSNDGLQSIKFKKTSSYNSEGIPNWDHKITDTVLTKQQVLENYDMMCFEMFDFYPNKQNSKLTKFDRTSNKKYYIASFTYDITYINPLFVQNMIKEGGLNSIDIKSVTLTYYIEKATLYIRKVEIDELYSITKGVKLDVNMHQVLHINSIGKALAPEYPSYC